MNLHARLWIAALLVCFIAILTGCGFATGATKGGKSHTAIALPNGGTVGEPIPVISSDLTAPENPKDTSQQTTRVTDESDLLLPAGTTIRDQVGTNASRMFTIIGPANLHTKRTVDSDTRLGAAQKNTAMEIAAKLASFRPVQILGVVMVLAFAAMFYPPVAAVVGSGTFQWVVGGLGAALIFLPVVVVDMAPTLQIGLVVAGIGIPLVWWLAHRHGELRGFVDADKDGVDDNEEAATAAAAAAALTKKV
jgi:hypothetical protein